MEYWVGRVNVIGRVVVSTITGCGRSSFESRRQRVRGDGRIFLFCVGGVTTGELGFLELKIKLLVIVALFHLRQKWSKAFTDIGDLDKHACIY